MHRFASFFHSLFMGNEEAYGKFTITADESEVKQSGKAETLRAPVTDQEWSRHLEGNMGLGIIPINYEGMCKWGGIDVDDYTISIDELTQKIAELKLPIVTCKSKSGGAHLLMFFKKPVLATKLRKVLENVKTLLGLGSCEIFPKQNTLKQERGDIGNWLNMPYFNSNTRVAFHNGHELTIEEFVELATKSELENIPSIKPGEATGEEIADGPPCLQSIIHEGKVGVGERNIFLFNLALYYKKSNPGSWPQLLEEANRRLERQLPANEIANIIQQIEKKEYNYQCKEKLLCNYCRANVCKTRPFGIRTGEEQPSFTGLTQIGREPETAIFCLTASKNGTTQRIEVNGIEHLTNLSKFTNVCLVQAGFGPTCNRAEWAPQVQELFSQVTVIVHENTITDDIIKELLEEYVQLRGSIEKTAIGHRELVHVNFKLKELYFSTMGFLRFCEDQKVKHINRNRLGEIIKGLRGGYKCVAVGTKRIKTHWIPLPEDFELRESVERKEDVL